MPTHSNFSKKLVIWYRKNKRDLPWRRTKDPYKIWISEIMLQQTTVNAVIPYYEKWIKLFPTVQSVAKAKQQKILNTWQGLGYYSRARNIHKSAQLMSLGFKGKVPNTSEELKKLPGFGPYTTGAVLSIAYGIPHTIIDANVRRVIMRQLAIEGFANTKVDKKVSKFLEDIFPKKCASDFNQGLMELGALICGNKQPLCLMCPVRSSCKAYAKRKQDIIPQTKKKQIKEIYVSVAIIRKNGSYYMQKRGPKGLFADLWEFPGGKIEKGETAKQAVVREIKEEINVDVTRAKHLFDVTQYYTEFKANLSVWDCEVEQDPPLDNTHKWLKKIDLAKYPMPSGSAQITTRLFN